MRPTATPPAPLRLADHPFFRGLPDAFVERIGAHAQERSFAPGEEIFRSGEPALAFYPIYTGKVALEIPAPDRPHLTVETVGTGEVLGWSWLVPPGRWRFDARVVTPARVLELDARHLREAMDADPADGYRLLTRLVPVIAERLENARVRLMDLYGR